ncbi:unnamed protein product [Adineta ricciae]|uniref:Uncharacterized protein n=1 Tax=Adineta ricciae TaxID=249248 RepID=A0A814RNV6_ADIRI|nr:unnamed protein product [Adineta ricciae]
MASSIQKNSTRPRILHVGFMVPLNEIMSESPVLERELGHLNLRINIYAAVLFYKDSSPDTLQMWFDQRKRSSRNGYLRAYYTKKNGDSIIEMDVDGKQFYLIASSATSQSPIEMKKDITRGVFGERREFAERIQVPCFPYKCDTNNGFTECEAFNTFKDEYRRKLENKATGDA